MANPATYLGDKTLIMIVGPTSIGKSTLMNEVVRHDASFKRVRSFTNRPARNNDETGHYIYLSDQELNERRKNGAITTDTVYPTTGYHYGTVPESYDGQFNMLDTLAHSVDDYRALPFKQTITVSMTANPDDWERWLSLRFPHGGDDMAKRLQEAILSIEWSLAQRDDHYWLINQPDTITDSAESIINMTRQPYSSTQPPEAVMLLQRAKSLLSYQ